MKQYEEVFFSVLRAALWKTPVEVPEGFTEWGKVMKLAEAQALTGLVGDVLLTTPEILNTLPPKFVAKLQMIPLENMGTHTVLNNTLILVVSKLREHGVDPVLLKGQGIVRYYPVPQLRQCGDIDLYVGLENYEKAYDALVPIATEIDPKSALEVGKDFHVKVGAVLLEVHRFAELYELKLQDSIFQKYASSGLTSDLVKVNIGDVEVNTPADNFNAYYLFGHLWRHFMVGGVGFRQLCDWMLFLHAHHGTLSKEYLDAILNDMHLLKPWKALGCVLIDYLGLPADEMPLYDPKMRRKASSIVNRVMQEGNFGSQTAYGRKRSNNYLYEKWFSLMCHVSRFSNLLFLFPLLTLRELWNVVIGGFTQVFHDLTHKQK